MESATVPKLLAKNVTLILHPWFQVVRRGLGQYLCFLLMPENTLLMQCPCCQLFLLYANSVFGWQNQFRKTATMHTQAGTALCQFQPLLFSHFLLLFCFFIQYHLLNNLLGQVSLGFKFLNPLYFSLITHFYTLFILHHLSSGVE